MPDLTEFVLARVAEDERLASGESPEPHGNYCDVVLKSVEWKVCTCDYPERMLDDCEAKREIVLAYKRVARRHDRGLIDRIVLPSVVEGLDYALHALAVSYASHPDYDPAWRPARRRTSDTP